MHLFLTWANCEGSDMRKLRIEEEILKDQPVIKDVDAICALCGAELLMDDESHEYSCPVCDAEDQPA